MIVYYLWIVYTLGSIKKTTRAHSFAMFSFLNQNFSFAFFEKVMGYSPKPPSWKLKARVYDVLKLTWFFSMIR